MIENIEEFERKNARRIQLIGKKLHELSDEERQKVFADHPAWYDIIQNRYKTDLTPEEEAELEQLQEECGNYLDKLHPMGPLVTDEG